MAMGPPIRRRGLALVCPEVSPGLRVANLSAIMARWSSVRCRRCLCAPVRCQAHRSCPHPVRRSDLRHNPAQAPQARWSRPRQRAAHQIRARLSLSLRRRMAAGRRPPRHNRLTRRRDAEKTPAIQPTIHRRPPKDRPHPRKPRQGRARPRHGHCAIIVGSRKTKPLL